MKTNLLKKAAIIPALLLVLAAATLAPTPAAAQSAYPDFRFVCYTSENPNQSLILIKATAISKIAGGLVPGRLVRFNGFPRYYLGNRGLVNDNGVKYYLCVFDDRSPALVKQQAAAKPVRDAYIYTGRFVIKGQASSRSDKLVDYYSDTEATVKTQMDKAGYYWHSSTRRPR